MMENNYYYSLEDFIKNEVEGFWEETFKNDITTGDDYFYSIYEVYHTLLGWSVADNIELSNMLKDPIVVKLWSYIIAKNLDEDIVVHPIEYKKNEEIPFPDYTFYNQVFGKWARLFLSVLKETYPRYKTIISLYEEQEQNLLSAIKNTSINVYNDTPQSVEDFKQSKYASNIAKYEGTTESDTLINRLDEIKRKWHNLYKEWVEEFDSLFVEVM